MSKKETRGRKPGVRMLTPLEKAKENIKKFGKENYRFNYLVKGFDQRNILENGWDLDIIDIAVFNQIKGFIDSGNAEKITDKNGDWYFISESKTINDLPCVPINSKSAVYKRISNLVKCGLIERNPSNISTRLKHIRVGEEAYRKLTYQPFNNNLI